MDREILSGEIILLEAIDGRYSMYGAIDNHDSLRAVHTYEHDSVRVGPAGPTIR